jgi:hypothetical protein
METLIPNQEAGKLWLVFWYGLTTLVWRKIRHPSTFRNVSQNTGKSARKQIFYWGRALIYNGFRCEPWLPPETVDFLLLKRGHSEESKFSHAEEAGGWMTPKPLHSLRRHKISKTMCLSVLRKSVMSWRKLFWRVDLFLHLHSYKKTRNRTTGSLTLVITVNKTVPLNPVILEVATGRTAVWGQLGQS